MNYLQPVPRTSEADPPARAVTVVSRNAREVVYLDQSASIEIITEALKAWGLRVRSERTTPAPAAPQSQHAPVETNWQTTRSEAKTPTRLENALSPLWLPIRTAPSASEPAADWGWFGRAA